MSPWRQIVQAGVGTRALRRVLATLLAAASIVSLASCALQPPAAAGPLSAADLHWLNTVSFGADQASIARLRELGRKRFLEEQLRMPATDPPDVAAAIAALPNLQGTAVDRVRAARDERQRIASLPDEMAKQQARQALNQQGRQTIADTSRRHLLRALYSPAQLREQMTWFWMNHFSVYGYKGQVRWSLPDYEENTIRPRALGKFGDLVLATVTAPAMLEYLDNAQSSANRVNENYARELMELHTLGVSGGPSGSRYTQQDVQELARVLTGFGVNLRGEPPRLGPVRAAAYRTEGLFEFNPNRHDFGAKTLLGQRIEPTGFDEAARAVAILTREPATARFISAKLAAYFVADNPPAALVDRMAATFRRTDGDISAVLTTMFLSPELDRMLDAPGRKFRDPMAFVMASMRLAYDGRTVSNLRPVMNWLNQLGEPLYGHVTPDGYPAAEGAWASSGQMVKRFEIARAMGSGPAGLFAGDANVPPGPARFPMVAGKAYYDTIERTLGAQTRASLAQAETQAEWNTLLLSSPEWMQR
ncbi:DUF1800 domain-containing protein [Cupriavidus pinatubonensis]|uniref:DUF1800 domain-containing protein n=1 Tax=Cupriavidus pinatubonensis TaxID=248026 RepID=A0ABN7XY83_9BURK|nr:DUF1800 domain-containing protein [Cupriavidus pinatubonensis]CAG9164627.1 hypothetical protein LMG23994_00461 [Cupriavidus pinatubonensis]